MEGFPRRLLEKKMEMFYKSFFTKIVKQPFKRSSNILQELLWIIQGRNSESFCYKILALVPEKTLEFINDIILQKFTEETLGVYPVGIFRGLSNEVPCRNFERNFWKNVVKSSLEKIKIKFLKELQKKIYPFISTLVEISEW